MHLITVPGGSFASRTSWGNASLLWSFNSPPVIAFDNDLFNCTLGVTVLYCVVEVVVCVESGAKDGGEAEQVFDKTDVSVVVWIFKFDVWFPGFSTFIRLEALLVTADKGTMVASAIITDDQNDKKIKQNDRGDLIIPSSLTGVRNRSNENLLSVDSCYGGFPTVDNILYHIHGWGVQHERVINQLTLW